MGMRISEKTFEINITNELLNLGKSILWYTHFSPFHHLFPEKTIRKLLDQHVLFAEGLTQQQESRTGGGYDVSININNPVALDKRIMFLQFKSGDRKNYRRNNYESIFHQSKKPESHIEFDFNDAADHNQHIILRELANQPNIQTESVMYVFPRITEISDFRNNIGNLIWKTSFVPVIDIDRQGANQIPPVLITGGTPHKFRTTYDGRLSEVNLLLFLFNYDNRLASEFIGELTCVYLERMLKNLVIQEPKTLLDFLYFLNENYPLSMFEEPNHDLLHLESSQIVSAYIDECISVLRNGEVSDSKFLYPKPTSKYTGVIPNEGVKIHFEEYLDLDSVQYQIF